MLLFKIRVLSHLFSASSKLFGWLLKKCSLSWVLSPNLLCSFNTLFIWINGSSFFPQSQEVQTHDTGYLDLGGKYLLPDFPFLIQIFRLHTKSLEVNLPTSEDYTLGGWGTICYYSTVSGWASYSFGDYGQYHIQFRAFMQVKMNPRGGIPVNIEILKKSTSCLLVDVGQFPFICTRITEGP